MRVRPILMSVPMARALVDGRKHQTRRVIKPQPPESYVLLDSRPATDVAEWVCSSDEAAPVHAVRCPHGSRGDLLWVRETWASNDGGSATRQASISYRADCDGLRGPWRPSLHMPRWASRITLRLNDVRVVRLWTASLTDIIAAGCPYAMREAALRWFRCQWEASYAKRGYGWETNPWVWVLQFDVMLENVDAASIRNRYSVSTNSSVRAADEE